MADSRREQLMKAFEEAEKDEQEDSDSATELEESPEPGDESTRSPEAPSGEPVDDATEPVVEDKQEQPKGAKEKPRGSDGKFVPKDAKGPKGPGSTGSKTGKSDPAGGPAPAGEEKPPQEVVPPVEVAPAPKAWRPAVREHWGKLPSDVREEITRRETEITQFIGQHGGAIQHKRQFDEVVQPYLPLIAAQQSTPIKAVANLMNTAARLMMGTPQQKASVIAEVIRNYGVDIKELDGVLGAAPTAGAAPRTEEGPPSWSRPIFEFMQEARQSRVTEQQRAERAATEELEAARKKPFFDDLSEDIGLLMQKAHAKGQLMTLDAAYDRARKMNPEIDQILTQREKAAKVNTGNGQDPLARARKAASTVSGAPAGGQAPKKKPDAEMSRREALAKAFDDLAGD
jgi:hypothetical protein